MECQDNFGAHMQRIYLPNTRFSDILEISEKQLYHQLTRVLRARVWQEVIFFDGEKWEDHVYTMIHIDKNSVSFKRKSIISKNSELNTSLYLYQAFPNKLSKFEVIAQKCSEVGYRKIVFFESERSQKLVISESKKERVRKISIEAIELCWGNIIPKIEFSDSFIQANIDPELVSYICHTQSDESLSLHQIDIMQNINIIVWPEWGFSEKEILEIPSQKVFFWERVLRCETVWEVVWFYLSQKQIKKES